MINNQTFTIAITLFTKYYNPGTHERKLQTNIPTVQKWTKELINPVTGFMNCCYHNTE